MQVLMIEDKEDDFLLVQYQMAKISDVQIEWRNSVDQGLAYLKAHSVDLLLLDLSLPDGQGLAIMSRIQTQFPGVPIIILSGDDNEALALEAIQRGAQDYLVKGRIDQVWLSRALRYAVERKRLEERLHRSDELYRTVARNFPNGALILYDHDLRYTLIDGLGLSEIGLSKTEMEGKTLYEIFPPEVAAEAEPRLRAVLAGETLALERVYAGQTLLMSYVPVRDSRGEIISGMIMSQNITERKKAEERFRALLESAPDAMVIVDQTGKIMLVNNHTESMFGYSRAELIGQSPEMLTPVEMHNQLEYQADFTGEEHANVIGLILTYMAMRKNGSQFPVEVSLRPIETEDGIVVAMALRDVSERRRVEEALSNSEAQFRNSFDHASVGMALASLDGKWLQVNRALCAIVGYTEAELLTKTFQDITHPDDLDSDLCHAQQLLAGEIESYQMEKRYFHKSGHEVWVLLSVSLVRDSQNQPMHFIKQIQDITQRKQAEAELAAERNLLRTLIDSIPDYVYVKDTQYRFVMANKAVLQAGGLTRSEQIIGKNDFDFFPADIAQAFHEDEMQVFATGQGILDRQEESVDLNTGDPLWFSTTKVPLRDEQGTITGLLGVSWDITERIGMEAVLIARIEAEHELQNSLKVLHEITIELTAIEDLDEFYKQAVRFGRERLGFDRLGLLLYDEAAALAIGTYGTDAEGKLVPEHHVRLDPSALTSILRRALEEEARFAVDEEAELFNEFKLIGRGWNAAAVLWNGEKKLGWLATDNGVQHLPMQQAQLNVLALYALTLGSLLAQKRTQIAVQDSEHHLRLLAENSPDVIYIMDLAEQRPTYLNRAEFLGYSQSEIQGLESLISALHPDDTAQVIAHWQDVIHGERDTQGMIEYRLRDKAGAWQWIQSRETIFASNAAAKPTQILVTLTVITERKLAEQRLLELTTERERVQLLSDFVRDTSHDFRTPLAVINTSLYILSKATDPEKQKSSLAKAQNQIARLTQLIDRLLIMARLDSESAFVLETMDVNRLAATFCTVLAFDAKEKGVHVVDAVDRGDLMIAGNAKELNLALGELGNNALWYTRSDGTITVRTRREGNQAVIEITDTGIGIPAEELAHIFQRLYRVDKARSAELGGSGLGLSIAKRIVELHQGRIEVESVVGQGSRFRVCLPLGK